MRSLSYNSYEKGTGLPPNRWRKCTGKLTAYAAILCNLVMRMQYEWVRTMPGTKP